MKTASDLAQLSIKYNRLNLERVLICLDKMDKDQLWRSINSSTNSIGNLILHLSGNIRQYIISGLGDEVDKRKRDLEFLSQPEISEEKLIVLLRETIEKAEIILNHLPVEKLKSEYEIQGFKLSGAEVILHVTEHFSYHVGQIALLVKARNNLDLGFYSGKDLNKRNS